MNNEITVGVYKLDKKRDSFAKLVSSGQDIGEAYNTAFRTSLSYDESFKRGKELCENKYVTEKINEYCDDNRVLSTINRRDIAIKLKRIADCNVGDYFRQEGNVMVIKPLDEWSRDMKVAFAGIRYTRSGVELKTYDKISSLNSIIKMMGWDKAPEESASSSNELSSYSDDQLKELLNSMENIGEIEDNAKGNDEDKKN